MVEGNDIYWEKHVEGHARIQADASRRKWSGK
jgi:hypothetical protein